MLFFKVKNHTVCITFEAYPNQMKLKISMTHMRPFLILLDCDWNLKKLTYLFQEMNNKLLKYAGLMKLSNDFYIF